MTDPDYDQEPPRPEPVLDAARIAGLVGAFVVALLGLVAIVLAGRTSDLTALGYAISGLLTAGAALAAGLAPWWQALKARAKVTPLEDPRDAAGTPLTPEHYDVEPATEVHGMPALDTDTTLIPVQTPRPAVQQQDGVADHADDGPRSEAARHARLNEPLE